MCINQVPGGEDYQSITTSITHDLRRDTSYMNYYALRLSTFSMDKNKINNTGLEFLNHDANSRVMGSMLERGVNLFARCIRVNQAKCFHFSVKETLLKLFLCFLFTSLFWDILKAIFFH